jgi:hypothetical protein
MVLLLGKRAEAFLPKVRNWMTRSASALVLVHISAESAGVLASEALAWRIVGSLRRTAPQLSLGKRL